jgi:hypothetical protein
LIIEQQAVLASTGEAMQRETYPPQVALPGIENFIFRFGEKTVLYQFLERFVAEMPLRNPADDLDVAQSAGAFLDIRFEIVGGIVEAQMPFLLLLELCLEELARRPQFAGSDRLLVLFVEFGAAIDRSGAIRSCWSLR